MYFLMLFIFLLILILNLLMLISFILSKKYNFDREINSPFECGFDPISSSRMPFSLRFFLICIVFLIFDVEIVLIIPIIPILNFSSLISWWLSMFFFILILLLGLFHEWIYGALEWSN